MSSPASFGKLRDPTSSTIPQQLPVVVGGDTPRRQKSSRTGSPKSTAAIAALMTAPENSHRFVAGAKNDDERGLRPGRPKGRKQQRRPHGSTAAGHTHPRPIYSPNAQIRGSPTLPPPERTEKGRGTHGGAGETGGRR
jgi:hypothetical protein